MDVIQPAEGIFQNFSEKKGETFLEKITFIKYKCGKCKKDNKTAINTTCGNILPIPIELECQCCQCTNFFNLADYDTKYIQSDTEKQEIPVLSE